MQLNETHHDFVEPVSYKKHAIARRCGAVADQYPIDKQDKIRCRKIMQPWRNR
ncbi:hypothetical protein HMPREF1619_02437 [Klebsiella pneumoniae 909957]|nr:hypothetical protein HMPREF1619_02437 [Klebsiella pneumoniae 909957]